MNLKLWLVMLGFGLGLSAHAVFQYDNISSSKNDLGSGKFGAVVDRGGSLGGLQNAMYFNQGAYLYVSFAKGEVSSFGAYYLDGKNKGAEVKLVSIGDGKYTAVDAAGNPIRFESGDSVGFWVTDANGKVVYNTPGIDNQPTYNGTAISNGNEYAIGFGDYGQFVGSGGGYDGLLQDASYVMNVQIGGTAPRPVGQPLPGPAVGLILAVLAGGGWYWMRTRKVSRPDCVSS